jgi:hypothetical protein
VWPHLFAARECLLSSDTSPPSRYRLGSPAGAGGATSSAPARSVPPRRAPIAKPSWLKVIATTLRLWVRRRILRVPDSAKIGLARWTALAAVAAVIAAAAAAGVVELTHAPVSHKPGAHARVTKPRLTPAQKQAQAAAARAVAANTTAAATWVAAQVSEQAVIGCDPAACAAMLQAGYGSGSQVVLQPGVSLPSAGAVVVATPAVRTQYGPELDAAAPETIAAFGSGVQAVQVRVVVPGGQAAYSTTASSAIAARRSVAIKLLANGKVHAYPAPRAALTAGLVDPRLLTVLQRLAVHDSVDIYSFSGRGPAADNSAPYRQVEIIGLTSKRMVNAIVRQLQALPSSSRPALALVRGPGGNYGLSIRFKAPSPD